MYERVRENTGPDKHLLPTATALLLLASSVATPTTGVSFVTTTTSIAASTARVATLVSAAITSTTSVTTSVSTTSISTTSSASIATTASTATSETTSSTSRATLASLVDTDGSAVELDVVHGSDSSLGVGLLAVTDEAETTAATSVTVLDDDSLLDGAKLLELLTKRILISVPCEAANEEL